MARGPLNSVFVSGNVNLKDLFEQKRNIIDCSLKIYHVELEMNLSERPPA